MSEFAGALPTPPDLRATWRYERPHKEGQDAPLAHGGKTTCYLWERATGSLVGEAAATCRPDEVFDKALGRHVSLQRALLVISGEMRRRHQAVKLRKLQLSQADWNFIASWMLEGIDEDQQHGADEARTAEELKDIESRGIRLANLMRPAAQL